MNSDDNSYHSAANSTGNSNVSPDSESAIDKAKHTAEPDISAVLVSNVGAGQDGNRDQVDHAVSSTTESVSDAKTYHSETISTSEGYGVVHSVGHLLRNTRIERQLSVEDVARQLRLSAQQVEAIEKEDYDKLPGRVFLRGFVRNYANLLQLDPAPIMQLLPNQSPAISPVERTPFKTKELSFAADQTRNWSGLILASVVLIFIGLVVYFVYPTDGFWNKSKESSSTIIDTDNNQTTIELNLPLSSSSSGMDNNQGIQFGNNSLANDLNTYGSLSFKFSAQAHVKVIDGNDATILDQNNAAGSEHTLSGKKPLFVIIHQAKDVELTYNDRPIEIAPYMNEEDGIARFTLE